MMRSYFRLYMLVRFLDSLNMPEHFVCLKIIQYQLVIVKTLLNNLRCLKVYDEILLQTIHASEISRQFKHARAFCLYHSRLFNIILRCSKVYHENYCRLYMHKVSRQFEHARDHIYFFSLRYSNIQVKSY